VLSEKEKKGGRLTRGILTDKTASWMNSLQNTRLNQLHGFKWSSRRSKGFEGTPS
jgi:hypothetical protein